MSRSPIPYTVDEREQIVKEYLDGYGSLSSIAQTYGIDATTVERWVWRYQDHGRAGLEERRTHTRYPDTLKRWAVEDYLKGEQSVSQIARQYNISTAGVLRYWINQYTEGKGPFKETAPNSVKKGTSEMTRGRKTTLEERLKIVQDTLAHGKNYQAAAEKFQVSYYQVNAWVKKYEKDGKAGLEDRRGKSLATKPNLTSEEQYKLKIKDLENRNLELELELAALKRFGSYLKKPKRFK